MAYQPMGLAPLKQNLADVEIFNFRITFGAASISKVLGKDATIVRNSVGNYTLQLPQTYRHVCDFDGAMRNAAGAVLFPVIVTDNSGTPNASATGIFVNGGTIIFEIRTAGGVPTDPSAGDQMFITLGLSRNFLNDKYEN